MAAAPVRLPPLTEHARWPCCRALGLEVSGELADVVQGNQRHEELTRGIRCGAETSGHAGELARAAREEAVSDGGNVEAVIGEGMPRRLTRPWLRRSLPPTAQVDWVLVHLKTGVSLGDHSLGGASVGEADWGPIAVWTSRTAERATEGAGGQTSRPAATATIR
jgi:hypothetical protein